MLALAAGPVCFVLVYAFRKWRAWQVQQWVHEQIRVASFSYAGKLKTEERLSLRASQNRRLVHGFGIDNSLTTESKSDHQAFLQATNQLLGRMNRSWEELFTFAENFRERELEIALQNNQPSLQLAESVRCMVLAVVLFDSFGIDPAATPRSALVTITEEINTQWMLSKCQPESVTQSDLLNSTIDSLSITSRDGDPLTPTQVLGLLMPQYETLWRVVLLTFVTAYHHQPAAYPDTIHRTASVPSCLGNSSWEEKEALKLAKEGLRLYPSNNHLYRTASPSTPTQNAPTAVAASIAALHRHPEIWSTPLAFRPSRFDDGVLTALQHKAYMPFSIKPHKCPAAGNSFGERMVVVLVVALGRGLAPGRGRVDFGEGGNFAGRLRTGRGEMEEWLWVMS